MVYRFPNSNTTQVFVFGSLRKRNQASEVVWHEVPIFIMPTERSLMGRNRVLDNAHTTDLIYGNHRPVFPKELKDTVWPAFHLRGDGKHQRRCQQRLPGSYRDLTRAQQSMHIFTACNSHFGSGILTADPCKVSCLSFVNWYHGRRTRRIYSRTSSHTS